MAKRQRTSGYGSLSQLDEGIHLLKQLPFSGWLFWMLGFLPFAIGLSFFVTDLRYRDPESAQLLGFTIGLPLLYLWRKACMMGFLNRLWKVRTGKQVSLRFREILRSVLRQSFVSGLVVLASPIAILTTVPAGYLFAAWTQFEILEANGQEKPLATGYKQAFFEQKKYHAVLGLLNVIFLILLLNWSMVLLSLPMLSTVFLDTPVDVWLERFSASPFVLTINCLMLAWFSMEPLVKAVFTSRCFLHLSQTTGEDLELEWSFQRAKVVILILGILLLTPVQSLRAEPVEGAITPAPTTEELQQSIEETLEHPEFDWRLDKRNDEVARDSWLLDTFPFLKEWGKAIGDFLRDLFENDDSLDRDESAGFDFSLGAVLEFLAWVLLALVVGAFLYLTIRHFRPAGGNSPPPEPAAIEKVDLTADNLSGEELTLHEWIREGDRLVSENNFRLAIRAYFLAHLSLLGERRLLRLYAFKSNRDYLRELKRHGERQAGTLDSFHQNVREFESHWYGSVPIDLESSKRIRSRLPMEPVTS